MASSVVSFCKSGMMSVCTAASDAEQNGCEFYKKSRLRCRAKRM
jgi:hypothetical protein